MVSFRFSRVNCFKFTHVAAIYLMERVNMLCGESLISIEAGKASSQLISNQPRKDSSMRIRTG